MHRTTLFSTIFTLSIPAVCCLSEFDHLTHYANLLVKKAGEPLGSDCTPDEGSTCAALDKVNA